MARAVDAEVGSLCTILNLNFENASSFSNGCVLVVLCATLKMGDRMACRFFCMKGRLVGGWRLGTRVFRSTDCTVEVEQLVGMVHHCTYHILR